MQQKRIEGVFSSGEGKDKRYCFARETDHGTMRLQGLDANNKAVGDSEEMDRDTFLEEHVPEPEMHYHLVSQPLMRGDFYRRNSRFTEAQMEYLSVAEVDVENIRANFGLGLVYLAANKQQQARYVFDKLVKLDEAFKEEHKHLFNELGIALRKRMLFDLTLQYYSRALELADEADEHLYFNMARALYEMGDDDRMFKYLRTALQINGEFDEALRFLVFLDKKELLPKAGEAQEFFVGLLAPGDGAEGGE